MPRRGQSLPSVDGRHYSWGDGRALVLSKVWLKVNVGGRDNNELMNSDVSFFIFGYTIVWPDLRYDWHELNYMVKWCQMGHQDDVRSKVFCPTLVVTLCAGARLLPPATTTGTSKAMQPFCRLHRHPFVHRSMLLLFLFIFLSTSILFHSNLLHRILSNLSAPSNFSDLSYLSYLYLL